MNHESTGKIRRDARALSSSSSASSGACARERAGDLPAGLNLECVNLDLTLADVGGGFPADRADFFRAHEDPLLYLGAVGLEVREPQRAELPLRPERNERPRV